MKPIEVFESLDKVVRLDGVVRQLYNEPLRSTDVESRALVVLSQQASDFLANVTLDDLKKYHVWVNSKIKNLEEDKERLVQEYEERLRQAELHTRYIARASAEAQ